MQTSIREKNGLQPIVNLIVNNLENAPILLNGLGAAYALSLKCSSYFLHHINITLDNFHLTFFQRRPQQTILQRQTDRNCKTIRK